MSGRKLDSEGALLGCAVPAANHVRRDVFSIARAHHQELRSNLASYRNDGDKEIANANNFQTVCVVMFFVSLFSGPFGTVVSSCKFVCVCFGPLYLVSNF